MLSIDARCLLTTYFSLGSRSTLRIGGRGALSKFTDRADRAMHELVECGYVTQKLYNAVGRMEYTGTDKVTNDLKLSFDEMETNGCWSPTEPVTA